MAERRDDSVDEALACVDGLIENGWASGEVAGFLRAAWRDLRLPTSPLWEVRKFGLSGDE